MKLHKLLIVITMLLMLTLPLGLSVSAETSAWDGATITQPTSMKTIDGVYYYEISTAEELAYIAKTGGDWLGYNYILANDIILNSVELTYDSNGNLTVDTSTLNRWTPIDGFKGIFDGNGYTIYGVYVDSSDFATFLGDCKEVKNLTLSNSYIRGSIAAGICDSAWQGVANCFFYGAVIGSKSASGICWATNVTTNTGIEKCINYGDIYCDGEAAGIVNSACGLISNCINYGSVFSKESSAAGICNQTSWDGNINNCSNYGIVNGVSKVAGIVSNAETSFIRSCQNVGNIKGVSYVGGICGHAHYMNIFSYTAITNSFNTGNIEGADYIGGICGYVNQAYVDSCYNTGNINGSGNYEGGVIGYLNYGDCKNSTNVGYVTNNNPNSETGALIGHSQSIWGDGVVSGCQYMKTGTVNTKLVAFGNTTTDTDNVSSKDDSFFCINSDKTLNKNGHSYTTKWSTDSSAHWHECSVCRQKINGANHNDVNHDHNCDICGLKLTDHEGGTATCKYKAICTICGKSYGDYVGHNFGEWIDEIQATNSETGIKAHKDCAICGKHFDANDNEIVNLIIPIKYTENGETFYELKPSVNDLKAGYDISEILQSAKNDSGEAIIISDVFSISFDTDAVKGILSGSTDVKLTVNISNGSNIPDVVKTIDISLDGSAFVDGVATVKVAYTNAIPQDMVLKVYYYVENQKREDMNAELVDGELVFNATHFSTYVVTLENDTNDFAPGIIIGSVAAGVVLITICVWISIKKKKSEKSE